MDYLAGKPRRQQNHRMQINLKNIHLNLGLSLLQKVIVKVNLLLVIFLLMAGRGEGSGGEIFLNKENKHTMKTIISGAKTVNSNKPGGLEK